MLRFMIGARNLAAAGDIAGIDQQHAQRTAW